MVVGAIRDDYDVAILMSNDTDLVPALEQVRSLSGKKCEVASWRGRTRLQVSAPPALWCHWLDQRDYTMLEDPTDYTRRQLHPPSTDP